MEDKRELLSPLDVSRRIVTLLLVLAGLFVMLFLSPMVILGIAETLHFFPYAEFSLWLGMTWKRIEHHFATMFELLALR